jgi:hypothetical protein
MHARIIPALGDYEIPFSVVGIEPPEAASLTFPGISVVILESLLMLPARRFRVVTICAPGPRWRAALASEVAKIDNGKTAR